MRICTYKSPTNPRAPLGSTVDVFSSSAPRALPGSGLVKEVNLLEEHCRYYEAIIGALQLILQGESGIMPAVRALNLHRTASDFYLSGLKGGRTLFWVQRATELGNDGLWIDKDSFGDRREATERVRAF